MNKLPALLSILAICFLALPACKKKTDSPLTDLSIGRSKDLTLAVDMELPNGTQHAVIKIKGDKARTDLAALSLSTIQSATAGSYLLNHQTKTIQKQAQEVLDTSIMSKDDAAKLTSAFAMKFTGKTETIAGWATREFLIMELREPDVSAGEQMRMAAWIAEEFPEGRDIQKLIERIMPNQVFAPIEKATGKKFTMPGFALRTEIQQGGNQAVKITYTAIKQGDIPESEFELPKDYLQSLSK